MTITPIGWTSALQAIAVCVLRGGNQTALKFALTGFAPFWTAFLRQLLGVLSVGAWAKLRGADLVPAADERRPLAQLSMLFIVQVGILHLGADYTSPAYAVILINSNPIFANLISHFVLPEDRLSPLRLLGLAAAFAGVAAVSLGKPEIELAANPALGNSLILFSAILVAVRLVYTQRLLQRIEPVKAVFWQMALSLPWFAAASYSSGEAARPVPGWGAIAGVAYQGVVISGVSFMAWATLLKKHSPGSLSVLSFSVPIFGIAVSAWLLSEAITARLVLGLALVISGIAVATREGRKTIRRLGERAAGDDNDPPALLGE